MEKELLKTTAESWIDLIENLFKKNWEQVSEEMTFEYAIGMKKEELVKKLLEKEMTFEYGIGIKTRWISNIEQLNQMNLSLNKKITELH